MVVILNLFALVLGCFLTALSAFWIVLSSPFSRTLPLLIQRFWGKAWLKLSGVDISTLGLENIVSLESGFILAANHASSLDILVLASLPVDFRWVAKVEIKKIPFVGLALKALGGFFVSRSSARRDMGILNEVEQGLRNGLNVAIFPEGTRTRDGKLLPFKRGAFRVSQNSGRPIVPIAIIGTYEICPAGEMIPRKRYHPVTVRIGQPIQVNSEQTIDKVMVSFREQLVKMLEKGHDKS